ncbi:MAG: CPXCG motif-containing cysteine-rich protein [Proteobacteria bacterium]|nr:CPXCG motif-containing cysteine-rich protein [Pseudomonadota bacterium]
MLEPGAAGTGPDPFVDVDCPYCGERYSTPLDLTAGGYSAIEDCPVCCRPIELVVEADADGALARVAARRLD